MSPPRCRRVHLLRAVQHGGEPLLQATPAQPLAVPGRLQVLPDHGGVPAQPPRSVAVPHQPVPVQCSASPPAVCADDADAALDDTAGELIFMARTCVQENVGDFCSTGVKSGTQTAVTVCRSDLVSSSRL